MHNSGKLGITVVTNILSHLGDGKIDPVPETLQQLAL